MTARREAAGMIAAVTAHTYRIPTEKPESDGTLSWEATTVLVVETTSEAGDHGLGFSYTSAGAAAVVGERLERHVVGRSVDGVGAAWRAMVAAVRNDGLPGIGATAISAVDISLWDLRARSLGLPLYRLLGPRRDDVPVYGSGGFTSYSIPELTEQLGGWVSDGLRQVKMKVGLDGGTRPDDDVRRVAAARDAVGNGGELFVDANGAYSTKQAVTMAERFADHGVTYFEEPVSSDHLEDMAFVRARAAMAIAAGEYGYAPWYFRQMLGAGAVDILQADVTRCLGITGFLAAGELAQAYNIPFSAHTAPTIHAHVACAVPHIEHIEYFHDHARLEPMLFDGVPRPRNGKLRPDPERPGLGLELRRPDADQWRIDT